LLPTLSSLSVSNEPETCLRHWCSSRYLRISLLHREFQFPLSHSIPTVFRAVFPLSGKISHETYWDTYRRFTPSNSEQRSHPTYYRGCWHVVGRCLFTEYHHPLRVLSPVKEVYNPKTVILHAASLHQTFVHCAIFPTAASRRSVDRVSVPLWPDILLDRLPVIALVSFYLANKLIGHRRVIKWRNLRYTFNLCSRSCCGLMGY